MIADLFGIDINGALLAGLGAMPRRGRVVPVRATWRGGPGRRAEREARRLDRGGSLLAAGSGYLVSTALSQGAPAPTRTVTVDVAWPWAAGATRPPRRTRRRRRSRALPGATR